MPQIRIAYFENRASLYMNLVLYQETWLGLTTRYTIYDGDTVRADSWCLTNKFWATLYEYFNPSSDYNVIVRDRRAEEYFPNAMHGLQWFVCLEPPCRRKHPRDEDETYHFYKCDPDYRPCGGRKWKFPSKTKPKRTVIQQQVIEALGDSKIREKELLKRFTSQDPKIKNAKNIIKHRSIEAERVIGEMISNGTLKAGEVYLNNNPEVWL